jgi:hypothetical protein
MAETKTTAATVQMKVLRRVPPILFLRANESSFLFPHHLICQRVYLRGPWGGEKP